jgi:hypothetical protein
MRFAAYLALVLIGIAGSPAPSPAAEADATRAQGDASEFALDEEWDADDQSPPQESGAAGSNPLASVSKIDLEWEFLKDGGSDINDFGLNGSTMLHPRLKFNFELHYGLTNRTGRQENDWESLVLKPIFFPKDVNLSDRFGLRLAAGVELAIDFGNDDKGIGAGSDVIAPLVGTAVMDREWKTVYIPLIQHFESYESGDVSQTAFRLILLQPLPDGAWFKLDAKLPVDWENHELPASSEFELGTMVSRNVGVYGKLLTGIGGERSFDWGTAAAVRIHF